MLRGSLLDGANVVYDKDYSKLLEAVSDPGVMSGFNIVAGKLQPGQAFVPVTRANTDSFYCFVENTAEIDVDVTGTKKIWLEVKQASIDDGITNAPDGGNIVELKTGASYPTKNFLKIASVVAGVVTDDRYILDNIQDLKQALQDQLDTHEGRLDTIDAEIATINTQIQPPQALVDDSFMVGENVLAGQNLFPESLPTYSQAVGFQNCGDAIGNTRLDFPFVSTGVFSKTIKPKIKKVGSPSAFQNLRLEYDNGVPVDAVNAVISIDPAKISTTEDKFYIAVTDDDTQTFATTGAVTVPRGYRMQAQKEIAIKIINKSATCTATIGYIRNDAGVILAQAPFVGNVATFLVPVEISNGTYFRVDADSDGASYTSHIKTLATFPQAKTNVSYIQGSDNLVNSTSAFNIDSIVTQEQFTFAGTFTQPVVGTKLHLVAYVGTYGSETINASNYYSFGYYSINTTTRRLKKYNGTIWSDTVLTYGTPTNDGCALGSYVANTQSVTFSFVPKYTLLLTNTDSSYTMNGVAISTTPNILLYAGVTYNFVGSTTQSYNKGATTSNNGVITVTSTYIGNNPNFLTTKQIVYDDCEFPFISGLSIQDKLLAVCDGDFSYKQPIDIIRMATQNYTVGQYAKCTTYGINNTLANMSIGDDLYINKSIGNTPSSTMFSYIAKNFTGGAGNATYYIKLIAPMTCNLTGFQAYFASAMTLGGYVPTVDCTFTLKSDASGTPLGKTLATTPGYHLSGVNTPATLNTQNFSVSVPVVAGNTYWLKIDIALWNPSSSSGVDFQMGYGAETNKVFSFNSDYTTQPANRMSALFLTDYLPGKLTTESRGFKVGKVTSPTDIFIKNMIS